ncbi:polysaccharide biosynthesis tyrosine autokinase [Pleurocapsales cyanobacterium LEGE 06147]|nr:polysaccharide biosynthesis tyrosine autokinase [Pleurocapsales cyanobacterium LEGE 06147]
MPDVRSDRSILHNNHNGNNGNGAYVNSLPIVEQITIDEDDESIDLRQLLNIVKHRFRLIAAVTLGVTAVAAIWIFSQEPKYRGSFRLLVEPVTQELPEEREKLALVEPQWTGLDYDTQIEVLRSPRVITPIIEKLAARYPEIETEELIRERRSPLKIERVEETKILQISYEDTDPQKIQFVIDNFAQAYLRYSLEERRVEIRQGLEFVENQLPTIQAKVDQLQEKLQKFRQRYNLLDPEEQATLLAQQLVKQEEENFNSQVKLNETKSLYKVLQQQLGLQPEQALAASYLSESPRYQNLLNQLQEVEVQLAQESTRFLPASPVVQALEDKREELLPLLQQEATKALGNKFSRFVSDSPALASPSSLRLELNQQYIQAANEIKVLEIRRQASEQAIAKLNQLQEQIPGIARQYTDLQRQLNVATNSLTRFLEAREKLQLESAQQELPWQLIANPSVEQKPIFPNPPRDLTLALIGGLLLGFGSALLAERLDPVFHSIEELQESIHLPVLGTIPFRKDLQQLDVITAEEKPMGLPQLQIGTHPIHLQTSIASSNYDLQEKTNSHNQKWYDASPFLEAFRSLNTNISLLGSDSPINSIVISSTIPSEGKSTVASHLAQAAAAMGQKVLLIDADLRRPQVHRWMGLDNQEGLSNFLATGLELEKVIRTIPQWENLAVVTAGDIPPDPTRLLSSKKMQELMDRLNIQQDYNLIIYDTPPLLGFADGRILSARTNGVILVVMMGKTDRSLLKQNIDSLKTSNVSILGLVSNQVKYNFSGSYYYSDYYRSR